MVQKNQTKALSFNVVQADGEELQVILGFRVMDGYIHPPKIFDKKRRAWKETFACSYAIAVKIFEAIKRKEWESTFDLPALLDPTEATKKLILTPELASHVAPKTLSRVG